MAHSQRHCAVRIPAALVILGGAVAVSAFSARSSSSSSSSLSSDGGITIVGLPGGGIESLPGMYVRSIRRWIEEEDGNGGRGGGIKMAPIPGTGGEGSAILGGWVDPTTTSELWWPRDLAALQVRPTLNILLRSGVLSYVSAGLDVRVPRQCPSDVRRDDGDDDDGVAVVATSSSWRNHGLNSQPIARQWTTLNIAMERMFHVEGFVVPLRGGNGKGGDDGDDGDDDSERRKHRHETLFPSLDARGAMERVATFIAEMDASSPLAEGFHIASFPMTRDWIDLPNDEEERVSDDNDYDGIEPSGLYNIVCLATSEPFASKLKGLDDDILAMSSTSVLEINVSRTAKGGESMCLPEVYKNLYLNGSTKK
ncbi:hypothetical protein ACHAW5_007245 [Stephanodiscus triporus]|uniref:Uncharacterized protein n=1 Tax=Stephanodiscus triporus TaxID=2934178 RepID=A0ABD3N5Q1_9STRA